MSPSLVYLDITELFNLPLRTGIQRVERELIRHWPGPARLILCIFDRTLNDLVVLPEQAGLILTSSSNVSRLAVAEERAALRSLLNEPSERVERAGSRIINAELFFSFPRARYYNSLVAGGNRSVYWLVYDFLPYLRPEWFEQGTGRSVMAYLWALRSVPNTAFISEHTRQDYQSRVMRDGDRDGPVISLGGDGLGLEQQHFSPSRDGYVVLGSVEPRKRVAAVLEAFETLWSEGCEARLTVIGRVIEQAKSEIKLISKLSDNHLFCHLVDASDHAIRDALRGARAMIFASEAEGFGLPPFEALFCGVPIVVGPNVPSVEMLSTEGQIRLDRITPRGIAEAVRHMQNDSVAEELWTEAATLHIPSWREFATAMAVWVQSS